MQRGLTFAIVDEVDSILIDEARTPLIISGPAEESTELYLAHQRAGAAPAAPDRTRTAPATSAVDEKGKQVHLTEDGHEHVEQLMLEAGLLREGESLYDAANIRLMHHLNAALRAHALYKRDVEYIVRNGEVIIVDEFTGRTMSGGAGPTACTRRSRPRKACACARRTRRSPRSPSRTTSACTRSSSGMTGTADTEAPEFLQIYGLEVVVIPTHRPMIRKDMRGLRLPDAGGQVRGDHRGHPRLRRRASSRCWSAPPRSRPPSTSPGLLQKEDIAHEVLNAKQHEREAHIVAQAGRPGHGHHRHQHGRPRHRHRARRQSRGRAARAAGGDATRPRATRCAPPGSSATTRCWPPAACTSSAPSATSRGASTTSCAAAPAARATRARAASTCRWKTT